LSGARAPAKLSREFVPVAADRLRSRMYVFGNGRESRSQFVGLKEFGPLKPLASTPKLLFVFRERDRQAGRDLAVALRGSRERYSFPGFEELFKTPLEIDPKPVIIPDFSIASMKEALDRVKQDTPLTLPVLILPDDEEAGYLNLKAIFTHEGLPTQVCTLGVIQDENTLRWSVANIALQLFCKAGGFPWKVQTTGNQCLILGISQSHKVRKEMNETKVEKFFAFSILTDSSGLFRKIQVLGQAEDEQAYLEQLEESLKEVLKSEAVNFDRVVIHTSFKLKYNEIDKIHSAVKQVASGGKTQKCRFAVVKVNHKSRFFGANQDVNSLVPYEGSRVRLGHGEYLVWFEGIFPDKPTVTKVFPGPTHLQFLRVLEENQISDEVLLQDLVNLAGANWRGFNAKSAPVSVFYCHLVADLVHDLQEKSLPLPAVETLKPWFL
ncbi:MAG: Piwi domain-containing protein, partial [Nitrososphaera sp.]